MIPKLAKLWVSIKVKNKDKEASENEGGGS